MDGGMDGWMDEWRDGGMGGCVGGWMGVSKLTELTNEESEFKPGLFCSKSVH